MHHLRCAFVASAVLWLCASATAQEQCQLRPKSVTLHFLDRTINPIFRLRLRVGDSPQTAVVEMDTGSTGIAIARRFVPPNIPDAPNPGHVPEIFYNSSGRRLHGRWKKAPMTLTGARAGESATTAPILFLEVDYETCDPGYPNCRPDPNPGTTMMGVGFGRPMGSPDNNPYLTIPDMLGPKPAMQRAYVITADSVTLGSTSGDVRGFNFIPLQRNPETSDWQQATGCTRITATADSTPLTRCGPILPDTGIDSMILALAPSQRPAPLACVSGAFPPGVQIAVGWPTLTSPAFTFNVTTAAGPVAPRGTAPAFVRWAPGDPGDAIFVNTGRHVIEAADYLFDDTCGRIGFRKK